MGMSNALAPDRQLRYITRRNANPIDVANKSALAADQ